MWTAIKAGPVLKAMMSMTIMKLQPTSEHPQGLPDDGFDVLFTVEKPVIFALHGYSWMIHRLTYRRTNVKNLHMQGYKEEGMTTTSFEMAALDDLDRFDLVSDVMDRVPQLGSRSEPLMQVVQDERMAHKRYVAEHGKIGQRSAGEKGRLEADMTCSGCTERAQRVNVEKTAPSFEHKEVVWDRRSLSSCSM